MIMRVEDASATPPPELLVFRFNDVLKLQKAVNVLRPHTGTLVSSVKL